MFEESEHRQFGDFVLHELLVQRKSMELYRATQQSLKRFVQFKIFALDGIFEQPQQLVQEFQTYIGSVLGLEHMHLQPIFGYGVIDDRHVYIVGRFMSGSLNGLLSTGALPLVQALEMALQIIMAVSYIHAQGFIHSSLSPRNVYLDGSGNAYIDDLELSLIVQKATSLSERKSLLDEPYYTSAEQLGSGRLDFRSEIYTLGAVLYHMVTGSPPFSDCDGTFETVLQRKLRNLVVPPRHLNPQIPASLEATILRTLRAVPEERFSHIMLLEDTLKQELNALEADNPPASDPVRSFLSRFRSDSR
jgi:serine/threonine protein kinase